MPQIFPRQNSSACGSYTDKIRSWCDTGDIYCDSGNNTKTHGSYFANYTTDAVDFIVGKFNETQSGSNGTDGGSSGGNSTGNTTGSGDGSSRASSVSVSTLPALVGILVAILGPAALLA